MSAAQNVALTFIIIANIYYAHATAKGDHDKKGHIWLVSAAIVTAFQVALFIWGP
jgi:hypothetical protein